MRRILVPLPGPEEAGTLLDIAAHLAAPAGAQIDVAYVPDPLDDAAPDNDGVGDAGLELPGIYERWAQEEAGRRRLATLWHEIPDGVVYASASLGRACDLIVTRSAGRLVSEDGIRAATRGERGFRDALLASGRAVLLAPLARIDPASLLETVVLAWDGSAGASHALAQSRPLLARARRVRVVIIGRNTVGEQAREAIAAYVRLWSDDAALVVQDNAHRQTGRGLLDAIRREQASLVVMGVCGRSHPPGSTGTALGGTLLKVIEDGRIPILTAT